MAFSMSLAILFSCSEKFLDKTPIGSTSENVFYNEKGVDALLIGAYALVSGGGLWDISWGGSVTNWTFGSVASDDAYKGSDAGDQIPVNSIERWEMLPNNGYNQDKWKWQLMGVTRINGMLKVLKETKGLTPARVTQFEAEAKFLRAWFNFEAWLVFKNIVILTEETLEPDKVPNTVDAMPAIIADLTFAMNNLPDLQIQAEPGRPTKYAAMAVLARVHLQTLNYVAAKPLLDAIIASNKFSLMPNFHDNFDMDTQNNKESIFEIQASVNNGSNESFTGEMGIGLNFPHGSDIGMCCGFHQPSQNLVNAFKVTANGLPMFDTFDDVNLKSDQGVPSADNFVPFTDVVDPRLDWTVSRRGIPYFDWGVNRGRDWIRNQPDGGPYMPASKFFFEKKDRNTLSTTSGWQTGVSANNFRYYRYSHVLLWRAEVAVNENDFAKAEELVNQIRKRAGNQVVMGLVTTYSLPQTAYPFNVAIDYTKPAANYKVSEYPTGSFATQGKAYALKAVQYELRLEFATEGQRFFDLRRWGIIKETLDKYSVNDLRTREFMRGKIFTDKAKWAPLPQSQLDVQPGVLVQNPGY